MLYCTILTCSNSSKFPVAEEYFEFHPSLSLSPSLPPNLGSDLTNQPQEAPGPGLVSPGDHLMMCGAPLSIYLGPVPSILRDDAMRTTNWSRKL